MQPLLRCEVYAPAEGARVAQSTLSSDRVLIQASCCAPAVSPVSFLASAYTWLLPPSLWHALGPIIKYVVYPVRVAHFKTAMKWPREA